MYHPAQTDSRFYAGAGAALDRETFHDLGVGTVDTRNERVLGLVAGVDTRRQQFLKVGRAF